MPQVPVCRLTTEKERVQRIIYFMRLGDSTPPLPHNLPGKANVDLISAGTNRSVQENPGRT